MHVFFLQYDESGTLMRQSIGRVVYSYYICKMHHKRVIGYPHFESHRIEINKIHQIKASPKLNEYEIEYDPELCNVLA